VKNPISHSSSNPKNFFLEKRQVCHEVQEPEAPQETIEGEEESLEEKLSDKERRIEPQSDLAEKLRNMFGEPLETIEQLKNLVEVTELIEPEPERDDEDFQETRIEKKLLVLKSSSPDFDKKTTIEISRNLLNEESKEYGEYVSISFSGHRPSPDSKGIERVEMTFRDLGIGKTFEFSCTITLFPETDGGSTTARFFIEPTEEEERYQYSVANLYEHAERMTREHLQLEDCLGFFKEEVERAEKEAQTREECTEEDKAEETMDQKLEKL